MHIPDGFLSPAVATGTWVVTAAGIAVALRAERRDATPMPSGVLGSVAAFIFAAQMVNVPVAPGTSGHLVGATLAALLLGPWRAMLGMATVLAVQALLFQDGGITTFGANLIDRGLTGCLVGYAIAYLVSRRVKGPRGIAAGGILGSFVATVCGAALVALWLAGSGLYPLNGILPVMLVTHVAIGLLEAALTGAILVTLLKWRPDLVRGLGSGPAERRPVALAAGVFGLALLVAAFLAPFASALPDGVAKASEVLGFAARAHPLWHAPMPDYGVPWARLATVAPAIAGIIGTVVVGALAWVLSRTLSSGEHAPHQ